jgi:hypothetical protein
MMSVNSKSLLGEFITKYTLTCCSKQSIKYVTEQFGHQYQTVITLVSLGKRRLGKPPPVFAGDLCNTKKDAEFSAAQRALDAYAEKIAALDMVPKTKKAKTSGGGSECGTGVPKISSYGRLTTYCAKLRKGQCSMKRGGWMQSDCIEVEGGFQCLLQVPCLPDALGQVTWIGNVGQTKKLAEEDSASRACQAIEDIPSLVRDINAPKKLKTLPPGGWDHGKGKGKDKGGFAQYYHQYQNPNDIPAHQAHANEHAIAQSMMVQQAQGQ